MKHIDLIIVPGRFTHILFWLFILIMTNPTWPVGFCAEHEVYPPNEPAKIISYEEAANIARQYLNMENPKNYKTRVDEKIITSDSYNSYMTLEPGVSRSCWIVTFIVPDAVGAGKTVYIDKKSGEILGGYSSK